MMRRISFLLALPVVLAGCATSSPDMMGGRRVPVTVEGMDFVVFVRDQRAEVVRMGYLTRGQRAPVPGLMARAATQASGCAVIPDSMTTRLPGDTGVAQFDLDCAGG